MIDIKELLKKSDYIITFGSFISQDNIEVNEAIIEAIAKNSAEFVYMHPIDDVNMKIYYSQFIKYEVGSEEGIATMLLDTFVKQSNDSIKNFIEDLDIGYISAESSAGEEEFEEAYEKSQTKENKVLIVGDDILTHERVESIVKILSVVKKYSDIEVVALDMGLQVLIDACMSEELEEIDELKSYNGTVLYRYISENPSADLVGSNSFARVAKVENHDEIFININGEKIKKTFVVDKNLQGTIALCAMDDNTNDCVSNGYRYKQVKIEKVDE